jgi:hypothetical protein
MEKLVVTLFHIERYLDIEVRFPIRRCCATSRTRLVRSKASLRPPYDDRYRVGYSRQSPGPAETN